MFQPLLFSLIGAEIRLSSLSPATLGWGLLVLTAGLLARSAAAFLAVGGGNNSPRERVFVALAWLPKATVQATLLHCSVVRQAYVRTAAGGHGTAGAG